MTAYSLNLATIAYFEFMVFGSVVSVTASRRRELATPTKVSIIGSQHGFHCSFVLDQIYENVADHVCEFRFVYPAESNFCIYKIVFRVDCEETVLQLHDIKEVDEIVQNMVAAGQCITLSETLPSGYCESVIGTVKPGQTLKVSVFCSCSCQSVGLNTICLKFPLEVANPHGRAQPIPRFDFVLDVKEIDEITNLFATLMGKQVGSFQRMDNNTARFSFSIGEEDEQNTDIKITVSTVFRNNVKSFALFGKDSISLTLYPQLPYHETDNNEFIILVDCSGSMSGSPINRTKEALEIFIRSLPTSCTFNVIRFGSNFEFLFEEPVFYSKEHVNKAIHLARTMKADLGGTDLLGPLQFIMKKDKNKYRQIFIITDGDVEDNNVILRLLKQQEGTRVFSIGLGRSADPVLVEGLAFVTGGMFDFVFSADNLSEKLVSLLAYAMSDRVTDVRIAIDGVEIEGLSGKLPQLIPQVATTVYIPHHTTQNDHKISIIGQYMGNQISLDVDQFMNDSEEDELSLFSMYSVSEIRCIMCAIHLSKSNSANDVKRCCELSLKSGVPCEFTAYLGHRNIVDKTKARRSSTFSSDFDSANKNTVGKGFAYGSSLSSPLASSADNGSQRDDISSNLIDEVDESHDGAHKKKSHSKKKGGFFSNIFKKKQHHSSNSSARNSGRDIVKPHSEKLPSDVAFIDPQNSAPIPANETEPIKPSPVRTGEFDFMNLLTTNNFNGSFSDSQLICQMAGKSLITINNDPTINATILAVALLRNKIGDRRGAWLLIETKASNFLGSQGLTDLENLYTSAQQALQ